jgi:hypothetical protein
MTDKRLIAIVLGIIAILGINSIFGAMVIRELQHDIKRLEAKIDSHENAIHPPEKQRLNKGGAAKDDGTLELGPPMTHEEADRLEQTQLRNGWKKLHFTREN